MLKRFSSFSLDTTNQCIHRGEQRIQLAPKAYAVLLYLIENPGRIITKEELLQAAWPDTFVQEAVLKTCILDIRKALGDSPKEPKHIATVHRRGYRFVDTILEPSVAEPSSPAPRSGLIGRDAELRELHILLGRAIQGSRQIAFLTGDAGIGKSTLIARFVNEASGTAAVRVLKGQCIEHFGAREAYYPVFDALSRGAKDGPISELVDVLRNFAPTWLVQMPGIASSEDREALKQETLGATRDRMLREMSEAIEVIASKAPMLFVLEDLHWSDVSTLDLVSLIASRSENARLLLIASYRPVDAILNDHPVRSLKQSLLARRACVEFELELLSRSDISDFLNAWFPNHVFPDHFAEQVHSRTEGNPLFVTNMLDYAVSRSLITNPNGSWTLSSGITDFNLCVPENLSKMIESQIDRLTEKEQVVLEIASVAGVAFAIHVIAGDDPHEIASAEACCDEMARRKLFLRSTGLIEADSGLVSAQYQFTHALYRDVLYKRLSPARRIRLHRTVGERLERWFESRFSDAASELALHFQECRDYGKAIRYLRLTAQRCATRHAFREALEALARAINLAEHLPEPAKRESQFELREQVGLLYRLMGQLTASAAEFENMFEQAQQAGNAAYELRSQLWLASVASWLHRDRCLKAVDTVVDLCGSPMVPSDLRVNALGQVAYWNLLFRGWDERDLHASAAALDAARQSGDRASLALHANRHSFFLSLSSQYRDACDTATKGVRIALENESLLDYSIGLFFEAWALLYLGEWGRMQRLLQSSVEIANRNGHHIWAVLFSLMEAFLHIEACSFGSARDLCRECVSRSRELAHPLSIQMGLVLLGLAELGAGNVSAARESFNEIREWQTRERILMDWIWKMPLQAGLTQLCLATGDVTGAKAEVKLLRSLASAGAERTWTALAHFAEASVAMADRDGAKARREIMRGLTLIENCEAPLAAWRLHALAAEVCGEDRHRRRAHEIIRKLAGSLSHEDNLKESFLSAAPVATVIERATAFSR